MNPVTFTVTGSEPGNTERLVYTTPIAGYGRVEKADPIAVTSCKS